MTPIEHVAVIVPARNEEWTIGETLRRIDRAAAEVAPVTTSCVVVLDRCSDATAQRVTESARRAVAVDIALLTTTHGCAGAARADGASMALATARGRGHDAGVVWLANTDADTSVPPDWLRRQLDLARRGVDAVAGVVELSGGPAALRAAFERQYGTWPRCDGDLEHHHVHGANLGVRASSYLAVGGWARLHTGEDHDLWRRLRTIARCVSSTSVVVGTSARLVGRAPQGFAADLRALADRVGTDPVEHIA